MPTTEQLENGEPMGYRPVKSAYAEDNGDGTVTVYGPAGNMLMVASARAYKRMQKTLREP